MQDSMPTPIDNSPAQPPKSAKVPHPTHPNRWSDGTQRPGADGVARKHPKPDLRSIAGLDDFLAGIIADQGGDAELATIRRGYAEKLTSVEGLYRMLAADVVARGIFTKKGRTRSTFTALLAVIEKWDRLAQRLGMERRTKDAGLLDLSAADYAAATSHTKGGINHGEAPTESDGRDTSDTDRIDPTLDPNRTDANR